jgi:hypothetical protein
MANKHSKMSDCSMTHSWSLDYNRDHKFKKKNVLQIWTEYLKNFVRDSKDLMTVPRTFLKAVSLLSTHRPDIIPRHTKNTCRNF